MRFCSMTSWSSGYISRMNAGFSRVSKSSCAIPAWFSLAATCMTLYRQPSFTEQTAGTQSAHNLHQTWFQHSFHLAPLASVGYLASKYSSRSCGCKIILLKRQPNVAKIHILKGPSWSLPARWWDCPQSRSGSAGCSTPAR